MSSIDADRGPVLEDLKRKRGAGVGLGYEPRVAAGTLTQQNVRMISVCMIMTTERGRVPSPLASCELHHTSTGSRTSIIESLEEAIKSLARDLTLRRGSGKNRRRSDDEPGCPFEQKASESKT